MPGPHRPPAERRKTIAFGPTSIPMVAHGIWIDLDGNDEVERMSYPVLGILVEHRISPDDEFLGELVQPAVWEPTYGVVGLDLAFDSQNAELVTVLPAGETPSDADHAHAVKRCRRAMSK